MGKYRCAWAGCVGCKLKCKCLDGRRGEDAVCDDEERERAFSYIHTCTAHTHSEKKSALSVQTAASQAASPARSKYIIYI